MSDTTTNSNHVHNSQAVRPVAAGDTLQRLAPAEAERDAIDRATLRSQTGNELTLRGIIGRHTKGGPGGEVIASLRVLLEGGAPTNAKHSRSSFGNQQTTKPTKLTTPTASFSRRWRDGGYPYKNLLSRKAYERQKYYLQVELLKLQMWVKETGQRVVILFEGRDAAGKGGAIKRFMEHLNPRGARIVALEKLSEIERAMVLPTRHPKPSHSWRDRAIRPQLV